MKAQGACSVGFGCAGDCSGPRSETQFRATCFANWLRWLFDRADEYAAESTWRDFALVKICLCAVGILLGLLVPSRHKPKVAILAGIAFVATYIPLMADFLPYLLEPKEE